MSDALRPRRSVLYMPAANERALEKAKTIPADALIFDLEDAVAPDAKEAARANACAAAGSGEYGRREVTIRCNGLDTPWGADDLAAAATSGAPPWSSRRCRRWPSSTRCRPPSTRRVRRTDMGIWAMVETPTAILDVRAIASHPRVAGARHGHQRPGQGAAGRPGARPGTRSCRTSPPRCWRPGGRQGDPRRRLQRREGPDGFRAECVQGARWASTARRSSTRARSSRATSVGAHRRRGRVRPARDRRVRRGGGRGPGRGHRRRPHDREPPRRQRPARGGTGSRWGPSPSIRHVRSRAGRRRRRRVSIVPTASRVVVPVRGRRHRSGRVDA
jgi:hypothetical protein